MSILIEIYNKYKNKRRNLLMSKKITEYGFQPVKMILHGETIYNIKKELEDELFEQFVTELIRNLSAEDKKTTASITNRELLLAYLPQLTSIEFDTANELEILEIIDKPSSELQDIMDEVVELIMPIMKKAGRFVKNLIETTIETTSGMNESEKQRYFNSLIEKNKNEGLEVEVKIDTKEENIDNEFEEFKKWKESKGKIGK
jgi:hypothetical protein